MQDEARRKMRQTRLMRPIGREGRSRAVCCAKRAAASCPIAARHGQLPGAKCRDALHGGLARLLRGWRQVLHAAGEEICIGNSVARVQVAVPKCFLSSNTLCMRGPWQLRACGSSSAPALSSFRALELQTRRSLDFSSCGLG